jgi:uncharacterized protein (TIRG00374 family)
LKPNISRQGRDNPDPIKNRLQTLLKVTISLGLIVYIFTRPEIRNADWQSILADFRPLPWFLALAIYFVAIGLQVLKWRYLLRTLGVHVPYFGLYRHNLVGLFFANLPLSMIGGDIARGWDLARATEGQGAQVAVSVLVDRLVGLAAFVLAAVVGLAYAVLVMSRSDLTWLLTTVVLLLIAFGLGFAVLMSQRLRRLVERLFNLGPFPRFLPLYQRLSDAVQVYRTHLGALSLALVIGLGTVATTCVVNYLAAVSVGTEVSFEWVCVLTPLTAFAPFLPSIASGLGWNQGVFIVLYYDLAGAVPSVAAALAMSLAMQLIILVASLPGGSLWWQKSQASSGAGPKPEQDQKRTVDRG